MRRKSVVENGENLEDGDEDSAMVKSSSGLSVSRRSVGNTSLQVCFILKKFIFKISDLESTEKQIIGGRVPGHESADFAGCCFYFVR